MPDGKQRDYEKIGGGNTRAVQSMTPEELEEANLRRPPSEKLADKFCGARKSKPNPDTGEAEFCSLAPGYGTDHKGFGYCKFHGGNTPAGKKAGARAMGREIIQTLKFGGDAAATQITPEEALLEEVRRSVAMVRWLEERIGQWEIVSLEELNDPSYRHSADKLLAGLPPLMTETVKGTPMATDVNSWLVLYREERQHMVKVSKLAIDAGIAERMVRIAESQGAMLASAIRAVLAALSLTPAQAELVPQVVPNILRAVASGDPIPVPIKGELVS